MKKISIIGYGRFGKILATIVLFETEFEWFIYIFFINKENIIVKTNPIMNSDRLVVDNWRSDNPNKSLIFISYFNI